MTKPEIAKAYEERFWSDDKILVVREEPVNKPVYDLEERTARFGETVIDFARTIPQNPVTNRIISQLVGAGTSVGANYVEADDAVSKKEFLKNIGTCRKEARETKHFLRMAVRLARAETPCSGRLAGSKRIAPYFFEDLEKRKMIFVIRASSFLRHSSFVIRHFRHA